MIVEADVSPDDQLFLMRNDRDSFNRWEANQSLAKNLILDGVDGTQPDSAGFAAALEKTLTDRTLDSAFKALMLGLPTEADIASAIGRDVDTDRVFAAREHVRRQLGLALENTLLSIWFETAETGAYSSTPKNTGRRSLRFAALGLLAAANPRKCIKLAVRELANARDMTTEIGALTAMLGVDAPETRNELDNFYGRHAADHLLVDKWFGLNAQIPGAGAAARIEKLMAHPAFRLNTPNRVYALIGGFTTLNPAGFNAADGEGYRIVSETILRFDAINPQVAARITTGFRSWGLMNEARRMAATAQLRRIVTTPNLSRDTFEIASRTLKI